MDEEARGKFQQHAAWLDRYDQANPNFDEFTAVPGLDKFIADNKEDIAQISNVSAVIDKVLNEFITPAHEQLIKTLDTIDIDSLTEKIVMRDRTQDQIFDSINEKLGTQFEQFEERVNKSYGMVDKLGRTAHGLNQKGNPIQGRNNLSTVATTLSFFIVFSYHLNLGLLHTIREHPRLL